jgi:hypothetical protein
MLFKKKKKEVEPPKSSAVNEDDLIPYTPSSEWIEGVHPELTRFRSSLKRFRILSLMAILTCFLYIVVFTIISLILNLIFSSDLILSIFGTEYVNPLHVIGIYVSVRGMAWCYQTIDKEFLTYKKISTTEEEV